MFRRLFASVSPRFLPLQQTILTLVMSGLVVVSVLAVVSTVMKTAGPGSAFDLHPYWYFGHFVRAGVNPYTAYVEKLALPGPVHYIDGSVVAPDAVAQPQLGRVPANTASMLLLLSVFSFLPWWLAKSIWLLCNLALIVALPWLTLRLLPPSLQLVRQLQWLAAFAFYAMKGPREAAASGQTSLLVFALSIVALLLRREHWLWAGLALGVALGKYSLSLPVFFFLLLEKRFRLLITAILVQVVAVVAVAAMGGASFWEILQVNWSMLAHHARQPGVHLGYVGRDYPQMVTVLVAVGSLLTLGGIWRSWRRGWLAADLLPINSVLMLWALLAVYHRNYDALMALPFLVLCLSAATAWQLSSDRSRGLGIFWLVALGVMSLPGNIVRPFVTESQADALLLWIDRLMTVTLAAMWLVNLWLIGLTPRRNQ